MSLEYLLLGQLTVLQLLPDHIPIANTNVFGSRRATVRGLIVNAQIRCISRYREELEQRKNELIRLHGARAVGHDRLEVVKDLGRLILSRKLRHQLNLAHGLLEFFQGSKIAILVDFH